MKTLLCFTLFAASLAAQITGMYVSPYSAGGSSVTFTMTVADNSGGLDVAAAEMLINTTNTINGACAVEMIGPGNGQHGMALWNPYSGGWSAISSPGQSTNQGTNPNCNLTYGSMSSGGATITYVFTLTFTNSMPSPANIYLQATQMNGQTYGWITGGTYNRNPSPVVTLSPAGNATFHGPNQEIVATVTDSTGFADVTWGQVLIGGALDYSQACSSLFYPSGALYLMNDAGDGWLGPINTNGQTLTNARCSLTYKSVTGSGNALTADYLMTPVLNGSMATSGNIWTSFSSSAYPSPGWTQEGTYTWAANTIPTVAISPSGDWNLSSLQQQIVVTATDPAGYTDLYWAQTLMGGSLSYSQACAVLFYPYNRDGNAVGTNGTMYLINDAVTAWLGPITGQGQTLSNSTCSIAYGSVIGSGNTLTATYTMTIALNQTANLAPTGNMWTIAGSPGTPNPSWIIQGSYMIASTGATLTLLPSQPGETVQDDYTGGYTTMPTSDSPTTQFNWTSSQGNWPATEAYPTDSFTTTIDNAAANTPVYVKVFSVTTGAAAFWFSPNCASLQPCQIGTTDSSGHFSYSGSWPNFAPDSYAEWWYVGNPGTLAETSTNPIIFEVGPNFVGGAAYTVIPAGQPITMALTHSITNASKIKRSFRRPQFKRKPTVSSSFVLPVDGGKVSYTFNIDTSEVEVFRIGDRIGYAYDAGSEANRQASANGWMFSGIGWSALDDAKRGPGTSFTMNADWLPGPVDVMIQGKEAGQAFNMAGNTSWDNVRMATKMGIRHNSIRTTVIGPAIPPGVTHPQLRGLIQEWITYSNLGFLQPMGREGSDLSKELEALEPKTDLEKQIVECLRRVL